MSVKEKLLQKLEEKEERMIAIRRHLHENPELSFEEENTAKYIADFYDGKDVKVTTGAGGGHGVIVEIEGASDGKVIGIRADFDALPIEEEADVPFKSKKKGVMHACGHDMHTAYMLILAESLYELRDEWSGTIKVIHQHAEEVPPGGAKGIVESGILDDLDEVYGIHIFPNFEVGEVILAEGESMAGRSNFDLKIQGKGGHAAMPSTAKDALVAGAHFVTQVQTVVSRRMDPADLVVVTVASFDAPGGYNVIQDSVTLRGTVRYMSEKNKVPAYEAIKGIAESLESAFGVTVDLDYKYDYPVLYNTPELAHAVEDILKPNIGGYLKGVEFGKPLSGSEDFAYYLEKTPGAFYYIGAKPEGVDEPYMNHHPKFEANEGALLTSAKTLGEVVLGRLQQDSR